MKTKINSKILALLVVLVIMAVLIGGYITYNNQNNSYNYNINANFISISIPIGAYSNYNLDNQSYPHGAIDRNINEKLSLDNPLRYLAKLVWFEGSGYLEYKINNPLPENSHVKTLGLFFEACSEAKGYSLDQKTDISVYINGKKIGTYTIDGDFGGKKGKYTPDWWPIDKTQYGKPIFVEVRDDGTYIGDNYNSDWAERKEVNINFRKVSNVGIEDLNLNQSVITLKIGVDNNSQHKGGMNIFGEKFGNYPKTLTLGLEYVGNKIYQPKMIDIINNPEKYENKTVIMAVHPGGWGCPYGKATPIPDGFSRSATMIYDDTGCLYGDGNILVGKVLSPKVHRIYAPGNETIVIKGKIKLDKNDIPFINPFNETNV